MFDVWLFIVVLWFDGIVFECYVDMVVLLIVVIDDGQLCMMLFGVGEIYVYDVCMLLIVFWLQLWVVCVIVQWCMVVLMFVVDGVFFQV